VCTCMHTYIQGAYVAGASLGFMVYCLRKDAPAACMLCERILWYVL
jgi:hypothetical protein